MRASATGLKRMPDQRDKPLLTMPQKALSRKTGKLAARGEIMRLSVRRACRPRRFHFKLSYELVESPRPASPQVKRLAAHAAWCPLATVMGWRGVSSGYGAPIAKLRMTVSSECLPATM